MDVLTKCQHKIYFNEKSLQEKQWIQFELPVFFSPLNIDLTKWSAISKNRSQEP